MFMAWRAAKNGAHMLPQRKSIRCLSLFHRKTEDANHIVPILQESYRCLMERETDIQLQHSIASQFDPIDLIAWSKSEHQELAKLARKVMALLGWVYCPPSRELT